MSDQRFPELGFYALPGHARSPTDIFEEVSSGDSLGLGSVWISERFNTKEIGVTSGIAAALSKNMGIAAGLISNLTLRHPLVVAGYGATMAAVTNNRFALGAARGMDALADMTGTPRLNFKRIEDYLSILRRLWRGESVTYHGPVGVLDKVSLGCELPVTPPIIFGAVGPKTCYWAGQNCDAVVFNSLWTERAVAASAMLVRRGAEDAGRDPASVRIWTIQVTACDLSEEDELTYIIRRLNTYVMFPNMVDVCKANGWDFGVAQKVTARLAEIDKGKRPGAYGDEATTRDFDFLRSIRKMYPDEWIYEGNAVGSAETCARATRARLDAGADGVLFHGSPPLKLAPLLTVWPQHRPPDRFTTASVNPGMTTGSAPL